MKKFKSEISKDLDILVQKIEELESRLEMSKEVSMSAFQSLAEVMLLVETLSRLLVSKDILTKKEIREKAKELDLEKDSLKKKFRHDFEKSAYQAYLNELLNSGSYGNA